MTTTTKITAQEIIDNNTAIINEYFAGIASGEYYNGTCYQLYLDLDDGTLRINQEASTQSWLQRDDGSLVMLHRVSGYDDRPQDQRYNAADGDDLSDFGLGDWLDGELTPAIDRALNPSWEE